MLPHQRLLEWLKLENKGLQIERFTSVFTPDAEIDDELLGRQPLLSKWEVFASARDIQPLFADGSEAQGVVVTEQRDPVTNLHHRVAWAFSVRDGLIAKVMATTSQGLPSPEERSAWLRLGQADDKYLREVHGFRDENDVTWTPIPDLAELETTLWQVLPGEHQYDRQCILQNDDLLYLPIFWIGSVGVLVSKVDRRVRVLGSAVSVSGQVWAYYRGFADGETGDERLNDLTILRVSDEKRTESVLRRLVGANGIVRNVRPHIHALPFRLKAVDLYFATDELKEAEEQGWFEFKVEPSSGANDQ